MPLWRTIYLVSSWASSFCTYVCELFQFLLNVAVLVYSPLVDLFLLALMPQYLLYLSLIVLHYTFFSLIIKFLINTVAQTNKTYIKFRRNIGHIGPFIIELGRGPLDHPHSTLHRAFQRGNQTNPAKPRGRVEGYPAVPGPPKASPAVFSPSFPCISSSFPFIYANAIKPKQACLLLIKT